MPNDDLSYPAFSYDEHARTCDPGDFLGQICRTVRGVPVADEQIEMIIAAIQSGLGLTTDDVLLELACGNGVLSRFLFDSCHGYQGVDISEHLITVAKKNFELPPNYQFLAQAAKEYLLQEQAPGRFTKMLCYAGFQYFHDRDITQILSILFSKFNNIQSIFIGSMPDRDHAGDFYKTRKPSMEELSDCRTAIGMWRTRAEFERLTATTGWKVEFSTMPSKFYASSYRFDALITRSQTEGRKSVL